MIRDRLASPSPGPGGRTARVVAGDTVAVSPSRIARCSGAARDGGRLARYGELRLHFGVSDGGGALRARRALI